MQNFGNASDQLFIRGSSSDGAGWSGDVRCECDYVDETELIYLRGNVSDV